MTDNTLTLKAAGMLIILFLSLFFTVQYAIQSTPPLPQDWAATPENIVKYDPVHLEREFEQMLEKVKRGEAISHEQVKRLKKIKRYLELLNVTPALLARLYQLIDEILALNDELIYPEDGDWRTDQEGNPDH